METKSKPVVSLMRSLQRTCGLSAEKSDFHVGRIAKMRICKYFLKRICEILAYSDFMYIIKEDVQLFFI